MAEFYIPDEIPNIGLFLREIREYHGYSIRQVAEYIGLTLTKVGAIERSENDVPIESVLRKWLLHLGLGVQDCNKVLIQAQSHRIKHTFKVKAKDPSNIDLMRIISAYRENKLTVFDRELLNLVART
jgi:transcriptional regulator with XRE-family HTH domain